MKKADLVNTLFAQSSLNKKEAVVVVNAVISGITKSLAGGNHLFIKDFGSFRIRERNARISRNPKSGETIKTPPKKIPFFKPGKILRELVDDKNVVNGC